MIIRPATSSDGVQIAAIWNPIIRNTAVTFNSIEKSPGDVAALLQERNEQGHAFYVAEREGTVVGFAHYGQFRTGIGYARTMEHTIILSDDAQGQGVGRALMDEVETHARSRGARSMFAGVSAENEGGVQFHAALGYKLIATLPNVGFKFDRWMDLKLMQKIL